MLANHSEKWVKVDGLAEPVKCSKGQFITGRYSLHSVMYPKPRKSTPDARTVWRWLQTLEKLENLTIKSTKRFSKVSIINWDIYQGQDSVNVQPNVQPVSNRCPTGVQPVSTNNNNKHNKHKKNKPPLPPGFENFWKAYPNKKNKGQAETTWKKIKPDQDKIVEIMAGIERAKKSSDWIKDNGKYIPHPSTWLNGKRWMDEHTPAQSDPDYNGPRGKVYGPGGCSFDELNPPRFIVPGKGA